MKWDHDIRRVKIQVYTPVEAIEGIRLAIGEAGGGEIGNYRYCAFVLEGLGHFLPCDGAEPAIGKVGKIESVKEGRIEFECAIKKVKSVVQAIKAAHPYEEVPIDIIPLMELDWFE